MDGLIIVMAIALAVAFAQISVSYLVPQERSTSIRLPFERALWSSLEYFERRINPVFRSRLDRVRGMSDEYAVNHPQLPGHLRRADSFRFVNEDGTFKPAGVLSSNQLFLFFADDAISTVFVDVPSAFGQTLTTNIVHNPAYREVVLFVLIFRFLIVLLVAPIIYRFLRLVFEPLVETTDA